VSSGRRVYRAGGTIAIFFIWGVDTLVGTGELLGATIALLLLHGSASAGMTYCLTYLFKSHSSAQNAMIFLNVRADIAPHVCKPYASAISVLQMSSRCPCRNGSCVVSLYRLPRLFSLVLSHVRGLASCRLVSSPVARP
jgi:hypothetical protein